jgi:hypothetical protein
MAVRRFAYCLDASESATNLIAVDPDAGTIPLYIVQNNVLFRYESTDTTTAHDGVTCLVTSDNKRYKSDSITYPFSVLNRTTSAQPGSPSVGAKYLVPAGATGAQWAGKDNQIAIYTESGWHFVTYPIGRFLYVEAETAFYHRNASGVWTAGVGSVVVSANTIKASTIIGSGVSFTRKVVNQTTNTPPGSPAIGDAYIIGPSPTGAWAGNTGKVAVCEAASTWTIYSNVVGESVYDTASGFRVTWTGTAWKSEQGAVVEAGSVLTTTPTINAETGTTTYVPSDSTGPTTSMRRTVDSLATFTITSRRSGQRIRFHYLLNSILYATSSADSGSSTNPYIAIYRDSDANALDWVAFAQATNEQFGVRAMLEITTDDAASHTYTIALISNRNSANNRCILNALHRRRFSYEMFA